MHKKSILALALIMAPLFTQAAATNNQLTFTWQGTVPTITLLSDSWKFTDASGNDYVPRPITLLTSINKEDNSLSLNTQAPATFEIRSAGANNISTINAYLASSPSSTGLISPLTLKTTLGAPAAGEVIVLLNGKPLNSGSGNSTSIESAVNNKAASMSLTLYAKVAQSGYTAGSSVSFSTPIIFSVDLASSGNVNA